MSAGLQLFDQNGRVIVDTTTWTGVVKGIQVITRSYDAGSGNYSGTNQSGSAIVSTNGSDRLFYFLSPYESPITQPTVSFAWDGVRFTINWSQSPEVTYYGSTGKTGFYSGVLLYGVY